MKPSRRRGPQGPCGAALLASARDTGKTEPPQRGFGRGVQIRHGLRWRGAPPAYRMHQTIYNRYVRWSCPGVLNFTFAELAARGGKLDRLMIYATHLTAYRTAASLLKKVLSRCIDRTRGGLNSRLHAVCDGEGRLVAMLLTERQMSDHQFLPWCCPSRRLPRTCSVTAAMPATASGQLLPSAASRPASLPHARPRYRCRP